MTGQAFLWGCTYVGIGLLCLALLVTTMRVIRGPTLPDRVLALDTLAVIAIGLIAVLGIRSGNGYHVDIAIALGLVSFLATVAFARFILTRGPSARSADGTPRGEGDGEVGQ
jgi:multicomponent Na+:H+ antiporter subunit F